MSKELMPRIDGNEEIREKLLSYCRLKSGEIWEDPINGHRVGVLDAVSQEDVSMLMNNKKAVLAIQDPPYNVEVGNNNTQNLSKVSLKKYIAWSEQWVKNILEVLSDNSHLYIWLGADQNEEFQPLPDFMIMMRQFRGLKSRSFITMRNQRGYGTQKNWMAVRQELLYYTRGDPDFTVQYTDIPKILQGYYKKVNGVVTENLERSKSNTIRPGNVWVDIQQVFYRMEENVPGCYAQKPLKAIERIVLSSSKENDLIIDFFAHSGSTLIASEKLRRQCFTMDIDPIFAEISIRRLERFRKTGKTGWQFESPFSEVELNADSEDEGILALKAPKQKSLFDMA